MTSYGTSGSNYNPDDYYFAGGTRGWVKKSDKTKSSNSGFFDGILNASKNALQSASKPVTMADEKAMMRAQPAYEGASATGGTTGAVAPSETAADAVKAAIDALTSQIGGNAPSPADYNSYLDKLSAVQLPNVVATLNTKPIDQAYSKSDKLLADAMNSALANIKSQKATTGAAYDDANLKTKSLADSASREIKNNVVNVGTKEAESFSKVNSENNRNALNDIEANRKVALDTAIAAAQTAGGVADLNAVNAKFDQQAKDAKAAGKERTATTDAMNTSRLDTATNAANFAQLDGQNYLSNLLASKTNADAGYDQRSTDAKTDYGNQRANLGTQKASLIAQLQQAQQQAQLQLDNQKYQNEVSLIQQALNATSAQDKENISAWNAQQGKLTDNATSLQNMLLQSMMDAEKSARDNAYTQQNMAYQSQLDNSGKLSTQQEAILAGLRNGSLPKDMYPKLYSMLGVTQ